MANDIDINLTLEQRMGQDLSTQSNLSSLTPNQIQEELVKKRAQLFHLNEKLASTEKQLSQTLDAEIATVKKEIQTLEKEDERRRLLTQAKLDAATLVQQEQEKKVLARRKAEAEKRSKQAQAFRVKHNAPLPTQNGQRLLSPAEIISGKLPVGASTYAPMRLITMEADGKLVHRNEYTGVGKRGDLASTEKELIEKYHFSPAEAKRRAPEFTPEQYEKLLPPITEKSPTVSKISGIMVGASDYRGSDVPGRKGTAYHTATEMNIGGWSIAEILKEYENKSKGQPSKLTEQQYSELYGLRHILKAAGGDKEILRQNVESFVEMVKKGIPAGSTPLMEQTLGAITNLGEGRLVPWGGTFDFLSKEGTLEDFKSNQKMSDKMGWQTNIYKFLIDLARMAGIDLPEVRQMLIANQPALTEKNLSPHPNIYGIKEIEPQTLIQFLSEALAQHIGLKKKDPSVFASEKDLFSTFGHSSYITPEGKSITYWTDAKYGGGLKKMLEKSETSEDIANLAQYLQGYAPQELDEVMRNLFAHTQYDETGLKTPVDYFTTGQNWPEKGKTPKDALLKRLSALRKKMLPNAVSLGEPGRIQEESFAPSDEQGFVDFIKLEGLNIGDWAVTYKTAKEEKDEELANQIVTFIASTLQDYFKDSGDMESIRLGKKLADKIKDLSGYATSQISEKVYESLSQQVGEALGVKYRTGLDSEQINYTTEAAKYYAEEATTTRDTFGSAQSADTEQIEYNKQRQAERDSFESMRDRMEENVGFAIEKWGDEWTKTISTQDPEIIAHLLSRNYVAADVYDSVFKEALDTLNEGRDGEGQKLLTTVDLLNSTQRQEYLVSKALQKRFGTEREQAEAENRPYSYIDSFASIASGKEFTDQTEGFARLMSWMNRLTDSPLYDETARSSMESIFQRYGVGGLKYKYNVHDPSIVAKILDNEGYVGLTANYKAPDDRLREAQEKLDSLTKEFQAFLEPYQGKQVFNDEAEKQKAYQETSRLLTLIMSAQNAAEQVKEQLQTIREPNQHEMLTSEQEEQLEELKIAKYLDVEEKHRAQQIRQEPIPLPEYLTPGYKAYGLEDVKITPDEDVKIIPDNVNLVDAFARLAGQDSEAVIPAIDGTVVEQQEAISALEQRAGVEQEAIKIDQQSTQALRDESEALKNKAEIARELISALEDKNKTEKEAIATDEKSTKSTRKRVTASETLKQRLANQKVREQIAESKAKEAAALSKAGRGSGAKKQSAGEKEDYSKYAKNLKEITKAMFEREKIEKELNTTPSMLAKGRESREKLLIEYEGIIGKLTAQNELMIEQGRLSKEQVAQIEAEAQAMRRLNSLKVQGQKGGASNIFEVISGNIKNTITRMFDYTGVYRVLNKLMASFSKVVQLSKELDSTMFNLRVVTGDSREETVGLIGDYRKLADQLGATTVQIANAANEWLRQGYEAQQANELITASTYLSKLGMIESGQATEYLTSMIKGFKLEVSDAIDVVSKLTAVDMEAASSAGDIAAALQNVSTTAQLAGVSLDETIAYATTIIETTQRDASSVGMALRTIMSRYGNVKAGAYTKMNLESSSDTDLENLNDIEKVLGKIGISIRSTNTEFRSFSDVLEELSDKWINLDNVSKNAIATAMAGVRQREQFLVLMENMDRVEELEQVSATSQGTAEQKYAAYMETIEAASNRLQSAWEDLAMKLEQSGLVKLFTDLAVLFTKVLLPAIQALGAALIQYNAIKIPSQIKKIAQATKDLFTFSSDYTQGKTSSRKSVRERLFGKLGIKSTTDMTVSQEQQLTNQESSSRQTLNRELTRSGVLFGQLNKNLDTDNAKRQINGKTIEENTRNVKNNSQELGNNTSQLKTHSKTQIQSRGYTVSSGGVGQKLQLQQKEGFVQSLKSNLPGAALAGIVSGIMGGATADGSKGAKIASGTIQGVLTGAGSVFGPVGSIIGSVAGNIIGPLVAKAIDKDATERAERVEKAAKGLSSIKSAGDQISNLSSIIEKNSFDGDDIKSIREYVQGIYENTSVDDTEVFSQKFAEEIKTYDKTLPSRFGYNTASELYAHLDDALLKASDGASARNTELMQYLERARIEAEKELYIRSMEEKRYEGMSLAEKSQYDQKLALYDLQLAYNRSNVSSLSERALFKMGKTGVMEAVADKLGVELTDALRRQIEAQMKTDPAMKNLLAGNTYTLREVMTNAYGLEDKVIEEQQKSFADAMGVSVDRLNDYVDTFGDIVIGNLIQSTEKLRESIESTIEVMDSWYQTGDLTLDTMSSLIKQDSSLITKIGNPDELFDALFSSTEQLTSLLAQSLTKDWMSAASPLKALEEDLYSGSIEGFEKGTGLDLEFGGVLKNTKNFDEVLQQLETYRLSKIAAKTLTDDEKNKIEALENEIIRRTDEAQVEIERAAAEYAKESYLSNIQDQLEHRLDKEVDALEEQKKMLQDINKQREYENKLIEAKIKLENAQNEKKKVWREGIGWVYEADTAAIADAEKELESLDIEKQTNALQSLIDELQAQRDWMSSTQEEEKYRKMQHILDQWSGNNASSALLIDKWAQEWKEPKVLPAPGEGTTGSGLVSSSVAANQQQNYGSAHAFARQQLATAAKNYQQTKGYQIMNDPNGGGLEALGNLSIEERDAYNKARNEFLSAISSGDLQEWDKTSYAEAEKYAREGGATPGLGKKAIIRIPHYDKGDEAWSITTINPLTGEESADFVGAAEVIVAPSLTTDNWSNDWKNKLYFMSAENKLIKVKESGKPKIKNGEDVRKLTNRLLYNSANHAFYYVGDDGQIYDAQVKNYYTRQVLATNADKWKYINAENNTGYLTADPYKKGAKTPMQLLQSDLNGSTGWISQVPQWDYAYVQSGNNVNKKMPSTYTKNYATGTLSVPGGLSFVNDDPQYGLEGIITPQGTLTALPSKSGVVPADMTRNVWQLGEVAPNLIKQLVDINGKFNSPLSFGTDESFNVDHLDVHMVAQPGFDMDDFVRQLRAARDLSKHS